MKLPIKIVALCLILSLAALGLTSYFYLKASRNHDQTIAYLNALQERDEWNRAREEIKEKNLKLEQSLRKKATAAEPETMSAIPEELSFVEEDFTIPTEIMEIKPRHSQDKTRRLLTRSQLDILESNIEHLKKAQRQNVALDRIEKQIRKIERRIYLLNPMNKQAWSDEEE